MTVGTMSEPKIEPGHTDDPLYREAMAHMQDGDWAQALEKFSALTQSYPNDGRIRSALEMAQFKADLDAGSKVRAKRWILPGPRVFLPLVVMAVIALLILFAVRFTTNVLGPMMAEAQQTRAINTALAQAHKLVEQERYEDARTRLQEGVLAKDPDNVEALGLLSTIEYESQLLDLYNKALALMADEDYGTATVLFQEIASRRPDYKLVTEKLAQIEELVELQQLYLHAELLDKMGAPQRREAIAAYEALRERNQEYHKKKVEARLIDLYLTEAQAILALEPAAPERLPEALEYLNKLVQLAPRHEQGLPERNLARTYQKGAEAHAAAEWEDAVDELEAVVEQRPDYLGGHAVELLYEALIEWADEFQAVGEMTKANELYARAKALPVDDTGRAQSGLAQTAPTPTPSPRGAGAGGGRAGPGPAAAHAHARAHTHAAGAVGAAGPHCLQIGQSGSARHLGHGSLGREPDLPGQQCRTAAPVRRSL